MQNFDSVVIGAGQAGPALAVRLAQSGRKTAIIERKLIGGTCVNVGCTPTKTLIASARAAHVARHASEFGVMISGAIEVDMQRVKARKDAVVKQSNQGLTEWLKSTPNLEIIEGHARFESANTLKVNQALLQAKEIFINVGGRPSVPKIEGLADVAFFTSSSLLEINYLPKHLIIIGGSYIGLEFAQMYRRFGSQVTVLEMGPRLIAREDAAVSLAVQEVLQNEGTTVHLNVADLHLAKHASGVAVTASVDSKPIELTGSHLLLAVGRQPNTDDLGLDLAGVTSNDRGFIEVDDQLRTNVEGIWTLGDANGRGAFTHTAWNDFEIVAANLLDKDPRSVNDRIATNALFIDPPLARVGLTEREVLATGKPALVGRMKMARVGRARERSETQGEMSVIVDAESKKILGAALLGIEADEVIHCIVDVMTADAPYTVIQRAVHIHPTVSELIPTLLGNLKPLTAPPI
jgi:pyruvate/2-oxoglutarate dehydrogenase complex dihydrolipoamide dehydrogenase (E3) component